MDGNIVVDGVLASCYAFPDHDLAHFGMTPFQLFPQLIKWLFGDNIGSPVFVEIVKHWRIYVAIQPELICNHKAYLS